MRVCQLCSNNTDDGSFFPLWEQIKTVVGSLVLKHMIGSPCVQIVHARQERQIHCFMIDLTSLFHTRRSKVYANVKYEWYMK